MNFNEFIIKLKYHPLRTLKILFKDKNFLIALTFLIGGILCPILFDNFPTIVIIIYEIYATIGFIYWARKIFKRV